MMQLSMEQIINIVAALLTLCLLIFAVDWRYFRDWIVVFLFMSVLGAFWGTPVVEMQLLEYPVRLLPRFFDTSILFEFWVFPVLCILYNQITRERSLWPIIYYAVLFSVGMTAVEYPIELYTDLIKYMNWSWFTTFCTLNITFLASRAFITFYRWGCNYFGQR